jgi:hypothetical protein
MPFVGIWKWLVQFDVTANERVLLHHIAKPYRDDSRCVLVVTESRAVSLVNFDACASCQML